MAKNPEMDGELQLFLRASEKLHRDIIRKIEGSGLFPPPLSYRGRIKRGKSLVDKIARRRRTKPNYGVKQVTDLVGIRFVTLMRMGISEVTDGLLTLLAKPANGEGGDFGGADFIEYKQFIAPPPLEIDSETGKWLDPLYDKLEAQLSAHFPEGPPTGLKQEIRAQYSGVHLVVKFPVEVDGHKLVVPAEIQVRSVFEEAWGEIDHKLFYKADRAGLVTGERRRLAASRHLGILKGMLDNAANYAELIYHTDLSSADAPKPDILPNLDGVDYPKILAEPITHRREVIDEFLGLVTEKRTYDDWATSHHEYLGLAHKFKQLFEREFKHIDPEDFPEDQRDMIRSIAFLMLMEQAISFFLDGEAESVSEAVNLYESITSEPLFPGLEGQKFPTAWFRMGEAKNWLMELSPDADERDRLAMEADAAFAKARKTLSAVPEDQYLIIAADQRAYLDVNIERLRGFALWRLSDKRRKVPGAQPQLIDLENVRYAWKVVEKRAKALRAPFSMSDLNLFNTATYFAADGLRLCEILGQPTSGLPGRQTIQGMLNALDEQMKALESQEELKSQQERFSHTILFCALLLGDSGRATRAAEEVMEAHVKADTSHFTPYQKDMHDWVAREAWAVIRPKGDQGGGQRRDEK